MPGPLHRGPAAPTLAERARTAVADQRSATLMLGSFAQRTMVVVSIRDRGAGQVGFFLSRCSPAVTSLMMCPVATLSLPAWGPYDALALSGPVRRHCTDEGTEGRADLEFVLAPRSARLLGRLDTTIAVADYRAAAPDPLRTMAAATITHLGEAHHDALLCSARRRIDPSARAVQPREIDR